MILKNILKSDLSIKIIHSFVGQTSFTLLSFLLTFVIARFFGAELFGKYTYIVTMVMFLSTFVKVGMDSSLIYFITKDGIKYISLSFFISLILSIVVSLATLLISDNPDLKKVIFLVFIIACQDIFLGVYSAYAKIKNYFIIKSFLAVGFQVILVVISYYFLNPSLFVLLSGFAISNIVSLFVFTISNKRKFKKINFSKEFVKYSIPMMFTSMMGVLMNRIDIIMLGNMGSMNEVGVYRVVVQIATITSLIMSVFNIAFAPKIAQLYNQNNITELKRIYIRSTRILFLLGICTLALIFLFSQTFLRLFGEEYVFASETLLIRSIGQFFTIAVGSVGFLLSMIGKVNLQLYRITIAALLNICLNYILINKYGINGAAIASMFALFISSITGYLFVKKEFGIKVYKYF